MSLIAFLLKNSSCPIHLHITMPKTDSPQVFPLFILRNFKIAGRASVVESHFSKVRETSAFCNSVENIQHVHGMLRKVAFLDFLLSPLLTGNASLQYTVCNATKNELLTKFLKLAFRLTENFQEAVSTEAPYQKFTDL